MSEARLLSLITARQMTDDAEVPTGAEVESYMSEPGRRWEALPYPCVRVYQDEQGPLPLQVWMDVDGSWMWSQLVVSGHAWATHDQVLAAIRGDLDRLRPPFITAHQPNLAAYFDGPCTSLLVRHPLTEDRIAAFQAILLERMPSERDYPVPAKAAEEFRRWGWTPVQTKAAAAGWRIRTAADAAVFTARSYHAWNLSGFPLLGRAKSGEVFGGNLTLAKPLDELPPPAMPAADAARMLAAGTRHDVIAAYVRAGIADPQKIMSASPPPIPDDATRIRFPAEPGTRGDWFATDTTIARNWLYQRPHRWLKEVIAEAGPQLLHAQEDGGLGGWMIWSDGALTTGILIVPPDVPGGEPHRLWHTRFRRDGWTVTAPLVTRITRALNRADLDPQIWMGWEHATGLADHEQDRSTRRTVVAMVGSQPVEAELTCTLKRHTVSLPYGDQYLWQVRESLNGADGAIHPLMSTHRHTWMFTNEAEAREHFTRCATTEPVAATVEELADMLGVTRSAIAHAQRRDSGRRAPGSPEALYLRGNSPRMYATRRFMDWWRARPGHGPGRGHTSRTRR